MKKILLALVVVGAISATSCKKDADIAPVNNEKSLKVNGGPNNFEVDKTDVGSWD